MRRVALVLLACLALAFAGGCSFLRSAEKTAAADYPKIKADTDKACADLPAAEKAGLVTGQAAKDAEALCAGVKFAEASKLSVSVETPAGSASVLVNVGGAPAVPPSGAGAPPQ